MTDEEACRDHFAMLLGNTPIHTLSFENMHRTVYRICCSGKRAHVQTLLRNAIDAFASVRIHGNGLSHDERTRVNALKCVCLAYNSVAHDPLNSLKTVSQLLTERVGDITHTPFDQYDSD